MDSLKHKPDMAELQEENDRLDLVLSATEKKAAIARLQESGLSPKDFKFDWRAIVHWIKTH